MAQNADLHLWRAVLAAGLDDARRGQRDEDTLWPGSADFQIVCSLADVDPDAVTRVIEDMAA